MPHQWIREVLQDMAHYMVMNGLHAEHRELSRLVRVFDQERRAVIPATAAANLIDLAKYRSASAR